MVQGLSSIDKALSSIPALKHTHVCAHTQIKVNNNINNNNDNKVKATVSATEGAYIWLLGSFYRWETESEILISSSGLITPYTLH